jgi:hypothetical protein
MQSRDRRDETEELQLIVYQSKRSNKSRIVSELSSQLPLVFRSLGAGRSTINKYPEFGFCAWGAGIPVLAIPIL